MRAQPIPASQLQELYDGRDKLELPAATQVWIAACSAENAGFGRIHGLTLKGSSGLEAHGYGATISIGHLALQVFGHEGGKDGPLRGFREGSVINRALIPIWPYGGGPVTMPPTFTFSLSQLEKVADAFETGK